ncbi:hypothetical protein XI06_05235 [Bradyrhizobium sp. CCBAU 11434]|nr:hypothetical protein [Bradyrhizobium sp. CCBAU 11434]
MLACGPVWKQSGFFAQTFCLFGETLFQRSSLLETAPLQHGAAPLLERAGALSAFSSQIVARNRAVMSTTVRPYP